MLGVVKRALKRHLPTPVIEAMKGGKRGLERHTPWMLVKTAKRTVYRGSKRQCPICESWVNRFLDTKYAKAEQCPVCRGIGRTRLVWLYLSRHTDLLTKPQRVLHIAPEYGIAARLMNCRHLDYWGGDLEPSRYPFPRKMIQMDLTDAVFGNDSFDTIICNHVLEHIPDDKAAMREILRILKSGGNAMLLVPDPHKLSFTIEDPDAPPEERARRFGQANHMRLYGADYADRLRSIGFRVSAWTAKKNEPELCEPWAIDAEEEVYIGSKAI